MQCDPHPDKCGALSIDAAFEQEVSRCARAVHFETQLLCRVGACEPKVMHRAGVEQLQIHVEASLPSPESTEQEHSTGVVEEQIVLTITDVLGDVSRERGVGDRDPGDCFGHVLLADVAFVCFHLSVVEASSVSVYIENYPLIQDMLDYAE